MNDWQKILDLVVYENPKEKKCSENLLLEKATKYIYNMLLCLAKDCESGKLSITKEEMKENDIKISSQDLKLMEMKGIVLGLKDTECQKLIIKNRKKIFENRVITGYINNPSFYKRHKIKKYDLEMLHQTVCKDMFQTMGKSYEYKTSLWVGVEVDTEEQTEESWPGSVFQTESNGIKLEIISGEILEYDGYVFDMLQDDASSIVENIKEMYRPYLVEYYITQKEFGEKQRIFLEQMYQEKGWYRAALADEVTDKDTEKYVSFEGVFVHSASPVEYERKKLIILDTRLDNGVLNKIKNTYNMDEVHYTSDSDIQKEWNKIFNGIRFQKAKIYKVGNGNCIYNYGKRGKEEKRFFYDIGFDMHVHIDADPKKMEERYRSAIQLIRSAAPHCIILSHWDEDHFRGFVYAKKDFFDIKWIAPNIKSSEKKGNAKRLLIYLYRIGSLLVVERGIAREIVIQHDIKSRMNLYVGNRQRGKDRRISNCNCQGIAILMENNANKYGKIRCLMQGDVPYMSLPTKVNFAVENPYEYLVVPHHGAEMDCSLLKSTVKKAGQAVICCTNELDKNRPKEEHLIELKRCYDDVKITEQARCYMQLDLQKKNQIKVY